MRPTGLYFSQRLEVGRRPAGPSFAARWFPLIAILFVTASAATAEEAAPAIPAALQRIYSAGVPASVDDLRLMDAHQRDLIQRLTPVTVGIEIEIEPTQGGRESKSGSTQGSGVIISPDGLVLTAAHVAGDSGSQGLGVHVRRPEVPWQDVGNELQHGRRVDQDHPAVDGTQQRELPGRKGMAACRDG